MPLNYNYVKKLDNKEEEKSILREVKVPLSKTKVLPHFLKRNMVKKIFNSK